MAQVMLATSPDGTQAMTITISETNACVCSNTYSPEKCVIHSSTRIAKAVIEKLWHEGWKVETLDSF